MTTFRTLDDTGDLTGKRVLLRVDLNVPMDNGRVTDATRIERVLPTIREIADKGGKVVLLAHFGRPKGRGSEEIRAPSSPGAGGQARPPRRLCRRLYRGPPPQAAAAMLEPGGVVLLENTRFHAGEEKNDPAFAKALAANGDLWVNDAFSAAHRAHASTEGLAHLLPAYAGRPCRRRSRRSPGRWRPRSAR